MKPGYPRRARSSVTIFPTYPQRNTDKLQRVIPKKYWGLGDFFLLSAGWFGTFISPPSVFGLEAEHRAPRSQRRGNGTSVPSPRQRLKGPERNTQELRVQRRTHRELGDVCQVGQPEWQVADRKVRRKDGPDALWGERFMEASGSVGNSTCEDRV